MERLRIEIFANAIVIIAVRELIATREYENLRIRKIWLSKQIQDSDILQIFCNNIAILLFNNCVITEFEFVENLQTQSSTMQHPRSIVSKYWIYCTHFEVQ